MTTAQTVLCPHASLCGGCQLQKLSYAEQLEFKQRLVESKLEGLGGVSPIIGMDNPQHYRNKVHAAFGLNPKRQVVSGIYKSSSHSIVPVDNCLIEDELADRIIFDIRKMLRDFKIKVYDERSGTGWLRHVLVRRGLKTGQVMVVLVALSPIFPTQKVFVKKLLDLHHEISTIVLNVNDRFGPVVLGTKEKILYGSGYIEDSLSEHRFRISSRSFYQVNPVQTEILYSTAIDFANFRGSETVLDAYCGIGTIGIIASKHVKQVVGIEINRDAVKDAIANAKLNGVKNCWFTNGDAGEYMEQRASRGEKFDLVFMDPPREGCSERFINSLLKCTPPRIIYISCSPDTLGRDLRMLSKNYMPEKIQPVDMFPYTEHVETVVSLVRRI